MVGSDHARALLERGFTVIENSHSPETVATLRQRLEAIYAEHGSPPPHADPQRQLSSNVLINPTGFVVFQLLKVAPDLAPLLLSQAVVQVAREVLGDDMHLELTGASISDPSRPFFTWHNHIGGIDVEDYRAREQYPRFERSERIIAVLYLDDIDADGGELLALPRAISDPTAPPEDVCAEQWPGQVELRFPRGSTLIFEQCTWHAVRRRARPGRRMFVGAYFTAASAPATQLTDDSLPGFVGGGELLQSVLPRT